MKLRPAAFRSIGGPAHQNRGRVLLRDFCWFSCNWISFHSYGLIFTELKFKLQMLQQEF